MYPKHKAEEASHLEMPVGADNKSPKKNLLSLVKEPETGHSQKTENSKNKNDPPPGEKTMEKTPINTG